MNDTLWNELHAVARRYVEVRRRAVVACLAFVFSVAGVTAIVLADRQGNGVSSGMIVGLVVASAACIGIAVAVLSRRPGTLWVARRVERCFPELNSRLITAVEQQPDPETGRLNYFQQFVVGEVLEHARTSRWSDAVSPAAWNWARRGKRPCSRCSC
ncbi:MAG: hypothetical protein QM754_09310 [Tepidisphaeraceae bacterium]